jgi:hypothetical protein
VRRQRIKNVVFPAKQQEYACCQVAIAPIERTVLSNVRTAGQKLDSAHPICQHDLRRESPIASETATEIQTDAMGEN